MLQLVAPLTAAELFTNRTFDVAIDQKGSFHSYEVVIDTITTNNVTGFTIKNLGFKNGTDTLLLELGGIDVDVSFDGSVKAVGFIKGNIQRIVVTNCTLVVELNSTTTDEVHWDLGLVSSVHIDDLQITMKQWVWQKLINAAHSTIVSTVNKALAFVPKFLDKKVAELNAKVATQSVDTWITHLVGQNLPLNVTMTKFVDFNESADMIELHNDMRFFDLSKYKTVPANSVWQSR